MVRLKPSPVEGVSQRARDFVYISKECGYPYIILALVSVFAWCGGAWLGPRVVEPVANAVVEALGGMSKTSTILAETNKTAIERELRREEERKVEQEERRVIINELKILATVTQKSLELLVEIRGRN